MEKSGEFRESLKSTDWAWIAGFLDGEGCFMIRKSKSVNKNYKKTKKGKPFWYFYLPRISLINTDKGSVQFLADAVDSNVLRRPMKETNLRPLYYVEIAALHKLKLILVNTLPYFKVKYRQAECLYRFCQTPRPGGPNRNKITAIRESLYQEFRRIAEDTGQAASGRAIRGQLKLEDRRFQRSAVRLVGNPEPSRRMKYADGRCNDQ